MFIQLEIRQLEMLRLSLVQSVMKKECIIILLLHKIFTSQ